MHQNPNLVGSTEICRFIKTFDASGRSKIQALLIGRRMSRRDSPDAAEQILNFGSYCGKSEVTRLARNIGARENRQSGAMNARN